MRVLRADVTMCVGGFTVKEELKTPVELLVQEAVIMIRRTLLLLPFLFPLTIIHFQSFEPDKHCNLSQQIFDTSVNRTRSSLYVSRFSLPNPRFFSSTASQDASVSLARDLCSSPSLWGAHSSSSYS